ncbi:MAG: twin-arginine translocation signal domain-containing protein, partial [Raoultibacter sp.]
MDGVQRLPIRSVGEMELDRRSFLKGAAGVGLISATAGLIGCAPSASGESKKASAASSST